MRSLPARLRPGRRRRSQLAAAGWDPPARSTPVLDRASDADLARLNTMLPWACFTVDSRGRRVGDLAWSGKRSEPQAIPDPRIERLHEVVDLTGKHVLEVGCFEGVHTIALCDRAGSVTAIDSRVENVAKTAVRCALYGVQPAVAVCDVEKEPAGSALLACDVVHHVGVLYHLLDPATHLAALLAGTREAVMLDTHYAREEQAVSSYEALGRTWQVHEYGEHGVADVFSGMYSLARWMRLDDLLTLLAEAGFDDVLVNEPREERNGARVLLVARRSR